MMTDTDKSKYTKRANICFDCENYWRCPWSAVDPETDKIRFEPVPGWTATPAVLEESNGKYPYRNETYCITACPQFVPTPERKVPHDYISETEQGQEPLEIRNCRFCGKEFSAKNKNHAYCSYNCRYKADLERKAADRKGRGR